MLTDSPAPGLLRELVRTRLDQLAAERADLGPALELQKTLLNLEIGLLEKIRGGGMPSLSLPQGYIAAKLRRGIPVLHGEPVPLPALLLAVGAREFCGYLQAAQSGKPADALAQAFDSGALDVGVLLSACFGRDQMRVRVMAAHHSVSADFAWLVAELALAPFAYLLQRQVFKDGLQSPAAWDRGVCPVCGSWPAFIEAGDAHVLRCSFCALGWELASYRCLYCSDDSETFVTAAPDPEKNGRRLQLCGKCGGYVKVLELPGPTLFPVVAIEDLASMDLDMAAIDRNYLRPALPEIKKQGAAKR